MTGPTQASAVPRRHARIELPRGPAVAWQGAGMTGVAVISSMGLGGLFIAAPHPPAAGSVLKLLFDVPGGEVRARGTVRYSIPGKGMGVQFLGMGFEDRARLHMLLNKLLQPLPESP